MSHYTDEPRFTIEQIDLLQRLRRTGMTKHEILHALETLDRLDQEHSDKFGRRSSYGGSSYGNSTNNVPASSSTATASTQTQHSGMSPSPSNSYDTSPQPCTTNQNGRENNERLSTSNGKMSPTRYHANSMGQRSYSFEASEEDLDVDDKVEELMRLVSFLFRFLQIFICLDWFWVIKLYFSSLHMRTVASLFPFGDKEKIKIFMFLIQKIFFLYLSSFSLLLYKSFPFCYLSKG